LHKSENKRDFELREISKWVEVYFREAPPSFQEIINAVRNATDMTWRNVATALRQGWTSPPSDSGAAALYRRDRLWDLFAPDLKGFETFVALGILQGIDVLMPSTQRILQESGWSVAAGLKEALAIKKQTGLNLIRNDDGVFEWLI